MMLFIVYCKLYMLILLFMLLLVVLWVYVALYPTPLNLEPAPYSMSQLFALPQFQFKDSLQEAQLLSMPNTGPQDIEIDKNGYIYTGLFNGSIYRIEPKTCSIQKIGDSVGRVLGVSLDPDDENLAFVSLRGGIGLINLESRQVKYYATQLKNQSLNSVTFISKKRLVFTVSGNIPMENFHLEILYRTDKGRIYQLDLIKNSTTLFYSGLSFPNGIDYDPAIQALYVNQLNNYRVLRIFLNDGKTVETVVSDLIGFPDNIKVMADGTLWIGIPQLRTYLTDLVDHSIWIRRLMIYLEVSPMIYKTIGGTFYDGGIRADPKTGQTLEYLQGYWDDIRFVTTINERDGIVVLGSSKDILIGMLERRKG